MPRFVRMRTDVPTAARPQSGDPRRVTAGGVDWWDFTVRHPAPRCLALRADVARGAGQDHRRGPNFGAGRGRCWHPARRIRGDNARYPDRAASCEQGIGPGISADPARQVFVTSRLDRSTASGGESRVIPTQLAPILERLGIVGDGWIETVRHFGRRFKTAVGRPDALAALAARRGKAWIQGSNAAALAFR